MREQLTYQTIKQNTYKTVRNALQGKQASKHIENSAQDTTVTKNQTDHIQNIVQGINVTWNQTEHIKKCPRH